MLRDSTGNTFAQGSLPYEYRPIYSQDPSNRVLIPIQVEGVPALAALDTGASYLILAPSITENIHFDPNSAITAAALWIHGIKYKGKLHPARLEFSSERGIPLDIEVTVFVLNPEEAEQWNRERLPSYLGMMGCLDRIRFALDPEHDLFYFGAGVE